MSSLMLPYTALVTKMLEQLQMNVPLLDEWMFKLKCSVTLVQRQICADLCTIPS